MRGVVVNEGPGATADPITMTMTIGMPRGSYTAQPLSPVNRGPGMGGHSVTCTVPAGLEPGGDGAALVPVVVENGIAPGTRLSGGRGAVCGPHDATGSSAPFVITVSRPVLRAAARAGRRCSAAVPGPGRSLLQGTRRWTAAFRRSR
ncbi:hypothetical protein AB0A71_05625 [Kitasatospora aureofaciens]|uniref:hypothetical protein n=1 Tax=Kitasatospora aureofaciens TaxID=1894 RepID=UPI00340D4651